MNVISEGNCLREETSGAESQSPIANLLEQGIRLICQFIPVLLDLMSI